MLYISHNENQKSSMMTASRRMIYAGNGDDLK